MTLKYESEILFDLMKRDGDDAPSDVLPYESELKEKYLQQVEGAYPKLQDYRPEWLNYNLIAHLPADFPVETISNVTSATVDNVVPYAYGSASLNGMTLFNIPTKNYSETAKELSSWVTSYDNSFTLKPNTKYYIGIFNYSTESKVYGVRVNPFAVDQKVTIQPNGYGYLIATTVDSITSYALVVNKATHTQNNNAKFLFIEYQEGMENWNIPYFEGMQSVQMPGLTTTGKNLWKHGDLNDFDVMFIDEIVPEGTYYLSGEQTTSYDEPVAIAFRDSNNNVLGHTSLGGKITINKKATQIAIYSNGHNYSNSTGKFLSVNNFMMEKDKLSSYEPYKTNILMVNEEVELRGIGNVKDELNLITGELTQRIGEAVYKGDSLENWYSNGVSGNFIEFARSVSGVKSIIACDRLPVSGTGERCVYAGNKIYVRLLTSRLATQDIAGFKNWLASNPLTIQYQLATESVKTVDFTVTDQDGNTESIIRPLEGTMHLMTEGDTLKPLFSGEIPVEAITQNLASFIKG